MATKQCTPEMTPYKLINLLVHQEPHVKFATCATRVAKCMHCMNLHTFTCIIGML